VFVFIIIVGAAFFISYGGINWWEAWLLLSLWLGYFLLMLTVVRKINPGVVEERSSSLERFTQSWDKRIIGIYQIVSLSLYVIAGLDVGRFGWTAGLSKGIPEGILLWLKVSAGVVVSVVYLLPLWAVVSNPFASGAVRIQGERGHYVIAKGPYRFIRHPMYLGTVLYGFAFPLFLESFWALIPGVVVIGLFVLRTALEDRYLIANLPGYSDYVRQTRFRLFPGIW
jgi:protein-S-isoprenylcysteine O-methyltransferase Ste14